MGSSRRWCRLTLLDDQGAVVAAGELTGETKPDLGAVDLIARLSLMARRAGATVRLCDACPELVELLELAGLPVEVERQTEGGKEPVRIEEAEEEAH
jgi:hypothetical protein